MLPDDCLSIVIKNLCAVLIVTVSEVSNSWKRVVEDIDNDEWKRLYQERVGCFVEVDSLFDWKHALVEAERTTTEVEAFCTWNKMKVRLVAPWTRIEEGTLQYENTILIGTNLRKGVSRDMKTTSSTQGICLHFVYDRAFELRGVRQTCVRRGDEPCCNCERRKRCNNQQYSYFLRKLDNPRVNEHLCLNFRGVVT